jgi:hypothetical protein
MKISSLRFRSLLLACAAFCIHTHAQEPMGPPRPFVPGQLLFAPPNFMGAYPQSPDGDLAMNFLSVPVNYPRPESDWRTSEKAFYAKLLSQAQFDTLVVPFQVSGWPFDRSTRALMTATLSLAIAQSGTVKTPDPYLVAKALGDGQRQITPEDVAKLANAMGVKRIIWGYAGHDKSGKMRIKLAPGGLAHHQGRKAI